MVDCRCVLKHYIGIQCSTAKPIGKWRSVLVRYGTQVRVQHKCTNINWDHFHRVLDQLGPHFELALQVTMRCYAISASIYSRTLMFQEGNRTAELIVSHSKRAQTEGSALWDTGTVSLGTGRKLKFPFQRTDVPETSSHSLSGSLPSFYSSP